jgi:rhomboid protease GluP
MTPEVIFLWIPLITLSVFAARYARLRMWQGAIWYGALALIVYGWHKLELPYAVPGSIVIWLTYGFLIPRLQGLGFQAVLKRDYLRAQRYEQWLAILVPLPAFRSQREMAQAFALMQGGEVDAGLQLLDQVASGQGRDAGVAKAQTLLFRSQYAELVELAGGPLGEKNASVRLLGIRALAEEGRLDDAIQAYLMEEARFRSNTSTVEQALTKSTLYMHAGDVQAVEALLEGPLSVFPETERRLIAARAQYMADGEWQIFSATLNQMRPNANGAMQRRVDHWLSAGARTRPPLSDTGREGLERLKQEQTETKAYFSRRVEKPRVALAIMVINILVFLFTNSGGQMDLNSELLVNGIFIYPYMAEHNEWWRLLTATFLHYNYLHVGFNMLALIWFGFNVEYRLGHLRFFVIYMLSGIGSMLAAIAAYEWQGQTEDLVALGASGSIFGVLGAVLGLAILTYHRTKLFRARQDITAILLIVALQTGYDWAFLQGSSPLHISGLICGMLITLLIAPRSASLPASPPAEPPPSDSQ